MELQEFINENRETIDNVIQRSLGSIPMIKTDEERRLWILNYEPLYRWALEDGAITEE